MEKWLAFDLEIAKEVPQGGDWHAERPLGVTCAGIAKKEGTLTNVVATAFHGTPQMTPEQCRGLADYLLAHWREGWTVVTWNGLGFDFPVLAEECRSFAHAEQIRLLARDHVDPAFAMLCDKGYMVGLDTANKGMGLAGKTEGMSGALAPVMWKQGEDERRQVLEYVKQDARATLELWLAIRAEGRLRWISRSGRENVWWPRALKVADALATPEPDTSWMDDPWPRSKFAGWLDG